jgi:phosphohistidine swiveling domain-containing protein
MPEERVGEEAGVVPTAGGKSGLTGSGDLLIADLHEIPPGGAMAFGGKAAGLVRLLSAGAKVPDGFALEATALPPDRWSQSNRSAFLAKINNLLETSPVAIRSSALREDSSEKSFAGLFETVLGVESAEEALAAAARCIASGRSDRVTKYAGTAEPLLVGLVVQRMVHATKAGVCFTRDPSGKDSAAVIEAVEGLGDALVSGRTRPARWRAYRSGLGVWDCRSDELPAILCTAEAAEIASGSAALEKDLGQPLDLEWAIDREGTLWWLQARPITTLRPAPTLVIRRSCPGANDGPVTVWSNWNVRETVPDPTSPLTFSFWVESVLPVVGIQLLGLPRGSRLVEELKGLDKINGRIYFNMNALLAIPILGRLAPAILRSMDVRAAKTTQALISQGVLQPRRVSGHAIRLAPSMLAASIRGVLRFRRALLPRRALRNLEKDGDSLARGKSPRQMTEVELLDGLHALEKPENLGILFGLQMETAAMLVYHFATRAFRGQTRALELLATGIPANPTTQISIGIEELGKAAAPFRALFSKLSDPNELLTRLKEEPGGAEWLALFRQFLERFGQRAPKEFDLSVPRWSEDPSMILGLVKARLETPGREEVRKRMERLAQERQLAVAEALSSSAFWKRPYLRLMARLVELYMPLREAPKHYAMFAFQRIRRCAVELGRRLAEGGMLDTCEDVFFLELGELSALALGRWTGEDLRPAIRERRKLHELFLSDPAPDFVRSDGVPVSEEPLGTGPALPGTFRGTPISAGRASGPVKVLAQPDPSAVSDGDVLVMVFADPGWTPLFPRASAVVMEVGGLMCHAAVVAREMGVPSVFGVRNATKLLKDGQRVAVDGSTGTVVVEGP